MANADSHLLAVTPVAVGLSQTDGARDAEGPGVGVADDRDHMSDTPVVGQESERPYVFDAVAGHRAGRGDRSSLRAIRPIAAAES